MRNLAPILRSGFLIVLASACLMQYARAAETLAQIVARGKRATALVISNQGSGTAFCISAAGFFVTNEHVVRETASNGTVSLVLNPGEENQSVVQATVVRKDRDADLALLSIVAKQPLTLLELGASDNLMETQTVTAFGFPFGPALAAGHDKYPAITVNLGRITALSKGPDGLKRIQLDAALQPGNSGSPILNAEGQVIGVAESGFPNSSINFAIPVHRLLLFLQRPEIAIEPSSIPLSHLSDEQSFTIKVASFLKSKVKTSVVLTLTTADGAIRRFSAVSAGADIYSVKAAPVPNRAGKPSVPEVLITIREPGNEAAFRISDQTIHMGKQSFRLSEIRQIERDDVTWVTLNNGQKISGEVTGLQAVAATLGGAAITLDLRKAVDLRIDVPNPPTDSVDFHIAVRQGGSLIGERSGSLTSSSPANQASSGLQSAYIQDPTTGHWYRLMRVEDDITWTAANKAASSMRYHGRKGHLVAITSAAENAFLVAHFPDALNIGCWLGGFQDHNAPDYREPDGGWRWVTGEAWNYTNWNKGLYQEPNDGLGGHEDFLGFTGDGRWNDLPDVRSDRMKSYLVEFE